MHVQERGSDVRALTINLLFFSGYESLKTAQSLKAIEKERENVIYDDVVVVNCLMAESDITRIRASSCLFTRSVREF
jgi:hypothetical protein